MRTTLIIAEKPEAARRIAEALTAKGRLRKLEPHGVPVFEVVGNEERLLVVPALGHLYEVDEVGTRDRKAYPVWDFEWKPRHLVERGNKKIAKWLEVISELAKEANDFICATDYDVEGGVIGYTILRYACGGADAKAKRMKFSTLTAKEIRSAFENLMPQLDYRQIEAGLCRHEVDWLYGINLSRALTQSAYKASGRYFTISTGRVQGPTLRFVVEREVELATFTPTPYWTLEAEVQVGQNYLKAEFERERIDKKSLAYAVQAICDGALASVMDIQSKTIRLPPTVPFDLTTLQSEAYRHFGISPAATLGIAERLYLDALISYPRTSSQKLPSAIGYQAILEGLSKDPAYEANAKSLLSLPELKPNEGKKEDPAHPCFPTHVRISLSDGGSVAIGELAHHVTNWTWVPSKRSYFGRPNKSVKVCSYDEKSGQIVPAEVKGVWKTPSEGSSLIKITTETGREIELTSNHPVFAITALGPGFVEAGRLTRGALIAVKSYEEDQVNGVLSRKKAFIGAFTPSQQLMTRRCHGAMKLLHEGNMHELDFEEVIGISVIPSVKWVYDIEVQNTHTFFANCMLVHNCIYPTGEMPKRALEARERKIYDLIVRRFMASFGGVAIKQSERAILDVKGYKFYLRGSRFIDKGWITLYEPYAKFEESFLPELSIGDSLKFVNVRVLEKYTQPPPRYNPSSLIRLMEEVSIGTKATRSEIVETLYKRGYIRDERMRATPLGFKTTEVLLKYCPKVVNVEFTRELEQMMEAIELGNGSRKEVLQKAIEELKPVMDAMRRREAEIGRELADTIREVMVASRTLRTPCPKCGSKLIVIRSRRTGKRFVGCSGKWALGCDFSLPLPQLGSLTPLESDCKDCGFQLIKVQSRGRRPMTFCPYHPIKGTPS